MTPMRPISILLAAAGLAAASAPSASAATIDFDSLAPGTTANAQFSAQGVSFNGSTVYDYGAGFAHSGTRALENCRAIEFCGTPPVRADFTSAQTKVGVWVGYHPDPSTGTRQVKLTALDAGGNPVGSQQLTLTAGAAMRHLEVSTASPSIRALEVKPSDGADSYDMVVDDVEFTTAGPPPPCPATGPPTISLSSPANDLVLQNDQLRLTGAVDGHGAPITDATVVADGQAARTAHFFPTPVGAAGGPFSINLGGLLRPGGQKVRVTATNCAGTGSSGNPIVDYEPLAAGAGFKQLAPVEVVQTVQSPYNPVPLIAGGPSGTKRTLARVQLSAAGVTVPITGVSGRLTATRPDGSRPGGPLTIDSLNTISVAPGQSLDAARAGLDGSLRFELPAAWLTAGKLHLQLEQLKIEGAQTTIPCQYCDNYGGQSATVTFRKVPPVRLWLVGVPYTGKVGGVAQTISPRQKDFDFLASWLRRAYPTAEVQVTQAALPVQATRPTDCHSLNDKITSWKSTIPAQPTQTKFYGVVSDVGGFMRGCSNIGGQVGSGPAGSSTFGWDNDGAYTDWYGGHEIGHLFGRLHPDGGCDDSDDDGHFPFPGGAIGDSTYDNQGIDVGDATLGLSSAIYDWRTGGHDVMTYCANQWLSSYTYNGILKRLCSQDLPSCPDSAPLTAVAASTAPRTVPRGGTQLAVDGTLDLKTHKVTLQPLSALKGLTPTQRPARSADAIVLKDARGRVLGSYPYTPQEVSDLEGGQKLASINEVVPFAPRTKRIEVVEGERVLLSKAVSSHKPTVRLRTSVAGALTAPVRLTWRAADRDGGKLLSTVQYAKDGKTFATLAAGLKRRSFTVDPAQLPGGTSARFRVVVTDGVLTGATTSKAVQVEAKAPAVSIATPVDATQLSDGQTVQLVASVRDDQDAQLGDRVVWSSDVQGELGRGALLTTELKPGTHELTATVTNSGGKSAAASVTVTVAPTVPTLDAKLVP